MLQDSQPTPALQPLAEADSIAQELLDHRARRAILRVRAQALQQVIPLAGTLLSWLPMGTQAADSGFQCVRFGPTFPL